MIRTSEIDSYSFDVVVVYYQATPKSKMFIEFSDSKFIVSMVRLGLIETLDYMYSSKVRNS